MARGGWDAGSVEYLTGSQKTTRTVARQMSSDSDSDVEQCALRFLRPMGWEDDSAEVEAFSDVSRDVMRAGWEAVATALRARPWLCSMMVPHDAEVAAGYGLIHTLCTKACPDDITDWVVNRTPRSILSIAVHKRWSTRELSSPPCVWPAR